MFLMSGIVSETMHGNSVVLGQNDKATFGAGSLGSATNSSSQGVDLYVAGSVGPFLACSRGTRAWTENTDFWLRPGASLCESCTPGQFQNANAQLRCINCTAGMYQNERRSTTCKVCPAGYFCPEGAAEPKECRHGATFSGSDSGENAVYCPEGYARAVPVAAGFKGASDAQGGTNRTFTSIVQVAPGFYSSIGVEEECTPGHEASIGGLSQCSPCGTGRFAHGFGTIQCATCPAGQFAELYGSISCSTCPKGYYSPANSSSQCLVCGAGQFAAGDGSSVCKDCTKGAFSERSTGSTACVDCPRGYYSPLAAASQCLVCGPGKVARSNLSTSCTDCPVAKFSAATASAMCEYCGEGHYSPATGSSACLACSVGTKSHDAPSHRSACEACVSGQYADAYRMSSCKPCLAGTYSPADSAAMCQLCGAGQFAAEDGSSVCEDCPINTFVELPGQASCKICPDDTESTAGSRECVQVVRFLLSIELSLEIPDGAPLPSCEKIANFSAQLAGVDQDDIILKTEGCPSTPGARHDSTRGTAVAGAGRRLSGTGGSRILAWEASISAPSSAAADVISTHLDQALNATLNGSTVMYFDFEDENQNAQQYSVHSITSSTQGTFLVESPNLLGVSAHLVYPSTAALVSWQHTPYAAAYHIYVSSSKNTVIDKQRTFTYSVNATDSPLIGDTLTIACSDLTPAGGEFYVRVVGVDENGKVGLFSSWSDSFVLVAPPGPLSDFRVNRGSGNKRFVASITLSINPSNPLSSTAFQQQLLKISYRPVRGGSDSDGVPIKEEAENLYSNTLALGSKELEITQTNTRASGPSQRQVTVSFKVNMHPGTSVYPYVFTASFEMTADLAPATIQTTVAHAECTEGTYRATHKPLYAQSCELCPPNAYCPENGNASTVVAQAGHWRVGWYNNDTSSTGNQTPMSLVFVRCPFPAACCGALVSPANVLAWEESIDRTPVEPAVWCTHNNSSASSGNLTSDTAERRTMGEGCAPGHYGVVCAQCRTGQARSANGRCTVCASVSDHTSSIVGILLLYFLLFSLSLLFACRTNYRLARTFQDTNLVKAKGIVDHWHWMVDSRNRHREEDARAVEKEEEKSKPHEHGSFFSQFHNPLHGHHLPSPLHLGHKTPRHSQTNEAQPEGSAQIISNQAKAGMIVGNRNSAQDVDGHVSTESPTLQPEGLQITIKPPLEKEPRHEAEAGAPSTLAESANADTMVGDPAKHHHSYRRRKSSISGGRRHSYAGVGMLLHIPPQEEAPDLDEVAYNAKSLLILTPDSMPGGLAVAKIFMTHFTILSLAGSFNVDWRMPSNWLLINIDFFSAVSREVFDVTCLQEEGSGETWAIPPHLMQLVVLLAIPVFNFVCMAVPWACLVSHLVRKHRKKWQTKNPGNDEGPKKDPFTSLSFAVVLVIGVGITCFFLACDDHEIHACAVLLQGGERKVVLGRRLWD